MIGPVSIAFGLATAGVVVLSALAKHRIAIWLSAMLAADWVAYTALGIFLAAPGRYEPLPLTDLGCLAICAAFAWVRRDAWIAIMAVIFMVQILMHLGFLTNWYQPATEADKWAQWRLESTYVLGLNITKAVLLLCVSWPGVRHVVEAFLRPDLGVLRPGRRVHP
jgi:hypothetical protein